jgi:hypothetical protein
VIELCAKTYFRSIAGTYKKLQTAAGQEKLEQKTITDRRRNRRSAVRAAYISCDRINSQVQLMHERRKGAVEFERRWGYKVVDGMLDTDYASSILSVDEEDLSEDSKDRRRRVEAGKGANMSRGKAWRSKRVRTFN